MTKTKYFDFKLYVQGLKKIRLFGIIASAIILALNIIAPVVMTTTVAIESNFGEVSEYTVSGLLYMPLTLLTLLFAPVFVLRMFNYLSSRSESDFYHSIPHSRPCVYFSFMAAAITWIWGIILATTLVTGLFWLACPGAVIQFSDVLFQVICYLLSTLVLMGFAAVAVSITGTTVSSFVVFVLLTFFFRVVSSMFLGILGSICPVLNTSQDLLSFFNPTFFMPLGLLAAIVEAIPSSALFTNVWCYLYTILLAAALLALGCVAYTKRKSESATRSAPNRKLQALYRCMITTPLAMGMLWIVLNMFFSANSYDYLALDYISGLIVLGFITVLVYFLYELIFTKSLKEVGRAALQLPILLGACVLIGATALIIRYSVYVTVPAADEIQSVAVTHGNDLYNYSSRTYEEACLNGMHTKEERARTIVADTLKLTVNQDKGHRDVYSERSVITIRLNNGRTLVRNISVDETRLAELEGIIGSSEEYQDQYLAMPSADEIDYYDVYAPTGTGAINVRTMWTLFLEEYSALSEEEKLAYKQGDTQSHFYHDPKGNYLFTLDISGIRNGLSFNSYYPVPANFKKTNEYAMKAVNEARSMADSDLTNLAAMQKQLLAMKEAEGETIKISEEDYYGKGDAYAYGYLYDPTSGVVHELALPSSNYSYQTGIYDTKEFYTFVRLIANDPTTQEEPSLSDYLLFLQLEIPTDDLLEYGDTTSYYTTWLSYSAALPLSEETAKTLITEYESIIYG